ncbi:MAG TPA: carbohydrate kinase [Gemmataceae bacterium]|nr:carbohydrate kinase [Gemmataceae bacterium]
MNPIVGIGEVLWDIYPDGRKVAGGAPFNFAFHCHQLGHPAAIVSRVGDDDLGRALRERVRELGLSDEFIQTDPDHPTGTVRVTHDASKVPTYTITENVAWDHLAWDDTLAALAETTRGACFGTLALRGGASAATIEEFVRNVSELCVFDVNLRQHFFAEEALEWGLTLSDWVKMSAEELVRLAEMFGIEADPGALFAKFHHEKLAPDQLLIVTQGADGAEMLYPARDECVCEPGVPANVVDTVGAGDSFTAAMVCMTREGRSLREAATFAVHYAARVCEHQGGTPTIDRADVERAAGLS